MSETETTPEVTPDDTPNGTVTPQETTPEVDYKAKFDSLQPEFTRKAQEAAELRQWQEAIRTDPDAQREFLRELGYDVEDDTPELPDDPTAAQLRQYEERLAAIEQKAQQDAVDRQLAEAEKHFTSAFQALGTERGSPVSQEEQDAIVGLALTMPPGEDGLPPVKAAAETLDKVWESRQQAWAASKKTGHPFTQNGGEVTEDNRLDVDDPAERQARMAARLAELNANS